MHDGLAHSTQPLRALAPVAKNVSARRIDRKRLPSPPIRNRSGGTVQTIARVRNARYETAHATVPSVTTSNQGPGLTKSEFEFCRQSLKTVFQQCTDLDFMQLSAIISCLLNCVQALHVKGVTVILALLLGRESGGEHHSERTEDSTVKKLQAKCSQVFFQDSAGFLHFAHPLIPKFLLAYPIKGIDRSHTVLAKACITQLDFDGGVQEFALSGNEAAQPRTGAFSRYAADNWQQHYREAERGTPSLTAHVHRMLWTEVMRRGNCASCGASDRELGRQAVSEALEFCTSRNFRTLSKAYSRLLTEIDSTSEGSDSEETAVESSRTFTESSAKVPDLDQVLAELQLSESDSDSDSSWSLVG